MLAVFRLANISELRTQAPSTTILLDKCLLHHWLESSPDLYIRACPPVSYDKFQQRKSDISVVALDLLRNSGAKFVVNREIISAVLFHPNFRSGRNAHLRARLSSLQSPVFLFRRFGAVCLSTPKIDRDRLAAWYAKRHSKTVCNKKFKNQSHCNSQYPFPPCDVNHEEDIRVLQLTLDSKLEASGLQPQFKGQYGINANGQVVTAAFLPAGRLTWRNCESGWPLGQWQCGLATDDQKFANWVRKDVQEVRVFQVSAQDMEKH